MTVTIPAAAAPPSVLAGALTRSGVADLFAVRPSPIGPLFVAWNSRGVSEVALAFELEAHGDAEAGALAAVSASEALAPAASFAAAFARRRGRRVFAADALPKPLGARVDRAFETGDARGVPLDLRGLSQFEAAVLAATAKIPTGELRPYGWVAREIGRPAAVRAVGTALGHNPVPLLIPCHRVVRSDGLIGNYSLGGPDQKLALLRHEGLDPGALELEARRGVRLIGSDATRIYCTPTCHAARRIGPSHRRTFASAGAAEAAGYRACMRCRP